MWVVGRGSLRVWATGTTFRKAHDGVELAPGVNGDIRFVASLCRFEDTENGVEAVGDGVAAYSLDQCDFIGCHNKVGQGGVDFTGGSTGGVVERGNISTIGTIRRCDFRNCAFGIENGGFGSPLDLGTTTSPGLNNFCIDYSLFNQNPQDDLDPYRVMLHNRKAGATLNAVGNWWLRNNQGANSNGHLLLGPIVGSVNEPPPAFLEGEFMDDNVTPWDRNFSVSNGATINFGTIPPPGSAPDCSVPP